jgi:hypothetical protein
MMNTLVTLSFILLSPAAAGVPARVAVMAQAPVAINALQASVTLPAGAAVSNISSQNSGISYWLTEPIVDAQSNSIPFAGVIPGGLSGQKELFEFSIAGDNLRELNFNGAKAYLDGPDATEVGVRVQPMSLSPQLGGVAVYAVLLLVLALCAWFLWRHLRVRLV